MSSCYNFLCFCVFSSYINLIKSQPADCTYGRFEEEPTTGNCMFDCNNDNNYVSISALSFDFIKSECPNVEVAATQGICDGVEDLLYRKDGVCDCPYCRCSSLGQSYEEILSYPPSKECFNCTCKIEPSYAISEPIFDCNEYDIIEASNPSEWPFYSCPPNICIGDGDRTYTAGDNWWEDTAIGGQSCETFCYCPGVKGDAICETGISNILSDPGLFDAFVDDCGSSFEAGGVKRPNLCIYLHSLTMYTLKTSNLIDE